MSSLARIARGAASLGALALVNRVTSPGDEKRYYRRLRLPSYAPPSWLFGVVWTGLNALQIWADQELAADRRLKGRKTLVALRGVNWVLYNLFSPIFFNLKQPKAAAAVSWAQLANTLATIAIARRRAPYLCAALLPAAAWLGFAAVLGSRIAADNPNGAVPARAARAASPVRRSARVARRKA
jgi:tryptophan-rich sensory protein